MLVQKKKSLTLCCSTGGLSEKLILRHQWSQLSVLLSAITYAVTVDQVYPRVLQLAAYKIMYRWSVHLFEAFFHLGSSQLCHLDILEKWPQITIDNLWIQENHHKEKADIVEETRRTCTALLVKAEPAASPPALHSLGSGTLTKTNRNLHWDITPNCAAQLWQGAAGNSRAKWGRRASSDFSPFSFTRMTQGHLFGLCSFSRMMLIQCLFPLFVTIKKNQNNTHTKTHRHTIDR